MVTTQGYLCRSCWSDSGWCRVGVATSWGIGCRAFGCGIGLGPCRHRELTRLTTATGALIANLPPSTRKEISDLFGLLALKPARALLGYSGDWIGADIAVVTTFLAGLRDSSIGLKQQAYFALHDLLLGSFYAEPSNWVATGYPGPPKLA